MSTEAEIASTIMSETVKIAFSGSVAVLKVVGKASAHAAALLATIVTDKKQKYGKMRLQEMVKEGVSLISISDKDKDKFREAMKEYGMKYCLVRNKGENSDGTIDIFIRSMDSSVVKRAMEKYELACVERDVKVEFKREEKLAANIISINRAKLVVSENDREIKALVPYTEGENMRYMIFDKSQVAEINGGASYTAEINEDKQYEILDSEGNAETIEGNQLLAYYKAFEAENLKKSASPAEENSQSERESRNTFREGDVSISRNKNSLNIEETEDEIITRIPGTFGDKERHVCFERDEVTEVYGGKSYKVHIDKEKNYPIYDKDGLLSGSMSGENLLSHYDRREEGKIVEASKNRPSVREHMKKLEEKSQNKFNNFKQREYDFDELERKLVSNNKDEAIKTEG